MGVVANMKQMGATRPYDAANGITTLGITSWDTVTGVLTIPATGTMFYVNFGTFSSYSVTGLAAPFDPGRKIVLMTNTASGEQFDFSGTAVASFPGTQGQMFMQSGGESLTGMGTSFVAKQLDTGAWVTLKSTAIS